ncbi:MAG TPA: hypothetical protein VJT31_05550, partial [Rugosimonospora sp.]|nr:hypothetical protein [Rugosimonospora sp.]
MATQLRSTMGETQYTTKPTSVEEIVRLAALELRAKISELADITTLEIQARIPEYARPGDEPYRLAQRAGVEQALLGFLDTLERRPNDTSWRDVYRAIGASERHQGRSLDALQAAIRIGARMGWRQLIEFAEAQALPVGAISEVADAIWTHVDDLASAAADGYSQAHAAEAGELDRRRRRLLDLLVQDPPATEEA